MNTIWAWRLQAWISARHGGSSDSVLTRSPPAFGAGVIQDGGRAYEAIMHAIGEQRVLRAGDRQEDWA